MDSRIWSVVRGSEYKAAAESPGSGKTEASYLHTGK